MFQVYQQRLNYIIVEIYQVHILIYSSEHCQEIIFFAIIYKICSTAHLCQYLPISYWVYYSKIICKYAGRQYDLNDYCVYGYGDYNCEFVVFIF